ncbi:HNH endonuclease [Lactococcus termiticola]|uniref:HNH nuclease domain-containing protein n=1 Tax=Lactococcus termiticola TaxID=2169526 RepID=A0A2R5HIU1_9LACT|nr:HNH endonuclease signature motif containing protein [Lactococcus termiticola]GBG96290.1 hypothetical protein NtB2_00401 [Lactococcus termiticola]
MENFNSQSLKVGEYYKINEIAEIFKCATQAGMNRSLKTNTLVLISKHANASRSNPYEDKWVNDTLYYTGMGRTGDQEPTRQNKTLAESNENGVQLHLFEKFKETDYIYAGQVVLADEPFQVDEEDIEGNLRKVYKFPLQLTSRLYIPDSSIVASPLKKKVNRKEPSPEILAERALQASQYNLGQFEIIKQPSYRATRSFSFDRNTDIRDYVLLLSNGICALCDQDAPFKVEGRPFLHSHHIEYLSNGGPDILDNCIAVCPNCHAKIHQLEDPKDKEKLLKQVQIRNQKHSISK